MTVLNLGDMQMMDGAKFPGIVIQASREELQAVAGNILYKEVAVLPLKRGNDSEDGSFWGEVMDGFMKRLCNVDQRVRTAKASRKYSRDEVLAMLDEIDPEGEKKGGAECQK